jgi:transcriptional regulator with XRE-family HTH domain
MRRKSKPMSSRYGSEPEATTLIHIVGENVKNYRVLRNLSQGELARRCNMQQASLSNLEAGKRGISIKFLVRLATVLRIHPGQFFFPPFGNEEKKI